MKPRGWIFPVVLVAVFLLLLGVTGERRDAASTAIAAKAARADPIRGAQLYNEYACVQCHGVGGKGRSDLQPSGPSLISKDFKQAFPLEQAVADVIKNGSIRAADRATSMPAWNGILSDEEVRDLVAYIGAGLPEAGVASPTAYTGEEIYRAFACIKCHGPLGTGGIKNVAATEPAHQFIPPLGGPELKKKYDSPAKVRKILLEGKLVEGGKRGVVYAPAWGRIGTAEQIEKVIEYILSD